MFFYVVLLGLRFCTHAAMLARCGFWVFDGLVWLSRCGFWVFGWFGGLLRCGFWVFGWL
jgi:hypothetical protein